jgi:3,4-dihydroxy 2-butanone 4-phosphate synthase/GTP cyclohydrolase II
MLCAICHNQALSVLLLIRMQISSTEEILTEFRQGRFVILVDQEDRENEGDLMLPAEFVTAEKINFLLKEARGLVCLTLSHLQVERLKLPLIKSENHGLHPHHAAFTFSIEAAKGVTTGISARERAITIQTAIKKDVEPTDIVSPGHVFPLRAAPGGVLTRAGHTEASVDLASLAGLNPSAVICEVLDEQGEAASGDYLSSFSKKFGIKIGTVEGLINFRKQQQVSP